MPAGQRKRKIIRVTFDAGSPVSARADWQLQVEDSVAKDFTVDAGTVETNLGPWASAQNLTLGAVRTTLLALVAAIPGHDVAN